MSDLNRKYVNIALCFLSGVLVKNLVAITYLTFDPINIEMHKRGYHCTQHWGFQQSHFNAAIFLFDNFPNYLDSSCASFGEKEMRLAASCFR